MMESCTAFKSNPWKPNICRDCRKKEEDHLTIENSSEIPITTAIVLPKCKYGRNCYRQNPDHLQSYSHFDDFEQKSKSKLKKQKEKELEFIQQMEIHVKELIKTNQLERNQYEQKFEEILAKTHDDEEKREIERQRTLYISLQSPSYWGSNALKELYREIDISNTSPEFHIINELINSTITTHGNKYGTIYGQDPTEFIITKIQRIQNTTLWHEYCYKKQSIIVKNRQRLSDCESSKYLELNPILTPLLDKQSNEYWLFHGCSHYTITQLVLAGYDSRVSNLKGMFGGGFYLAENSSKSNQYIPCPRCNENAIGTQIGCTCSGQETIKFKIMLYRAVLGDVHIAKIYNRDKYCYIIDNKKRKNYIRRPPIKINTFDDLYDSVMGESKTYGGDQLEYREFILYENGQAYPEYVIEFQRSIQNMRPQTDIKRVQEKCRQFLLNTFRIVPE
ncbi:hypothetical protein I4U23_005779 [Adineta vaga]|nr:hypothetical protein I4U23_005779 [Adineta vaga]